MRCSLAEKGKTMAENYISLERAIERMYKVTEECGTERIFIDRIIDELENLPSSPHICIHPQWIPVSERLPDIGGCYLVVVKYKYDFEKEYNYDTDVATFEFGYDQKNIDGHWITYVDWDEGQQYMHVTHCMPLPEPPKEENDG